MPSNASGKSFDRGPRTVTDETDRSEDPTGDEAARLEPIEARVLGCLVEKESTTPDAYPLTLNALTTACNQKTSRDPVMKLEPGEVGHALRTLERKGLARHQFFSRADRYRHTAEKGLELTRAQLAVVALLMLRGPQTIGELLTRSERLHRFDDAEDVAYTLERLMQKDPALAVRLPRQSGQREDRYAHCLCGPVEQDETLDAPSATADRGTPSRESSDLSQRVADLEQRLADLEARLGPGD